MFVKNYQFGFIISTMQRKTSSFYMLQKLKKTCQTTGACELISNDDTINNSKINGPDVLGD